MLYYGGDVLQVRVPLCFQAEFHPVVPVFGLQPAIHCCSNNRDPCSVEVTSNIVYGARFTCLQDCCQGKGKVVKKLDINKVSGTQLWPKLRTATSAMEFSTPVMYATMRGPVWGALWMSAKPFKRCLTVQDCDLLAIHVDQTTVDLLSGITPAHANCMSISRCITHIL